VARSEAEEVARIAAEYEPSEKKAQELRKALTEFTEKLSSATKSDAKKLEADQKKLQSALERQLRELAKRDEEIAAVHRKAKEDHQALVVTAKELENLYSDPDELLRHARVVGIDEIEENEYNLNIPRYVDTFEPEEQIDIEEVMLRLSSAESARQEAEQTLRSLLTGIGFVRN
jgi:type I restriction enzyme M protein